MELKVYYVDFLCIHKKYRGKNLATFLISEIINRLGKQQVYIFKKEGKPLPFNYINKTSYYYIDVSFINKKHITNRIEFMTKDNINDVYNFINKVSKKTLVYSKLNLMEFIELYHKNKSKNTLIEYDKHNNITSILSFVHLTYYNSSQPSKTADIEHIYVDGVGEYQIFDYL